MAHTIGLRYQASHNRQGRKTGPEKPVLISPRSLDRHEGRYVIHVRPGDAHPARSPNGEEAARLNIPPARRVVEVSRPNGVHEVYIASMIELLARPEDDECWDPS